MCNQKSVIRVPPPTNWAQLPNKKLLCCLSSGTDNGGKVRADCEDNSSSGSLSFNEAWIKTDDPSHGGNLHALILVNGLNKPITGFFKANGDRCNQFTEFKAPSSGIQPITVNPLMTASQQAKVSSPDGIEDRGSRIPMIPNSQALNDLKNQLNSSPSHPTYPDTAAEWRECPILVRAVMISSCDTTSPCTLPDSATPGIKSCASAQNIRFLIRVEQIATIAGRTPLKAFETTVDSAAKVDVSQLLKR